MERVNKNTIKLLKLKDKDAFNTIFLMYNDILYFYVYYYVRNEQDAKDLVQDIFLTILSKIHLYDENYNSFNAWVMTIARNLVLNFLRDKKHRLKFFILNEELVNNYAYYESDSHLPYELEEIKDVLGERRFAMIVYRYVHNLTYKEIAKIFNTSAETVRREIKKSLKESKEYKKNKKEEKDEE